MGGFFILFAFAVMIAPIFLRTDLYLRPLKNKCTFSVSLYGILPIAGGYIRAQKGGVEIHFSDKKAAFLAWNKLASTGKKFDFTKGFQLYRLHIVTELEGGEHAYGVLYIQLVRLIGELILGAMHAGKPFLDLDHSILISNRKQFQQTIKCAFVFNILILLVALTKKLLEATIKWTKKRKLTALWKKQRARSQA